jgi:hypothetical protein
VLPALTAPDAERWVRAGFPRVVTKWVLPALWAVAFAVAVITDTAVCTPAEPCGPEQSFTFWVVACFATPVLLLWLPLLGCAAGVAFALADLWYDDVRGAQVAFGTHGALCAVVAVLLVRSARRQAAVLPSGSTGVSSARVAWRLPPLVLAGVMAVVGVGLLGLYRDLDGREQTHLARAVQLDAEVVGTNSDDYTVDLLVNDRRRTVDVTESDDYPVGSTTPVLLDPQDSDWVRLVAEPNDVTYWESGGLGALLLGLLLVGRELQRRAAVQRLLRGEHPAIRVTAAWDGLGEVRVLLGRDEVAHYPSRAPDLPKEPPSEEPLDVEEVPDEVAELGQWWRGEELLPEPPATTYEGVLVGELHDRGWAILLLDDGPVLPLRPLRVRRAALHDPEALDPDEQPPGVLVTSRGAVEPALPLVLRPTLRGRALGVALAVAGLVGGPVGLVWLAEGRYEQVVSVLIGAQVMFAGARRFVERTTVDRQGLAFLRPLRREQLPWELLHGVRLEDDTIHIAYGTELQELGPYEDVEPRQLAATLVLLRERALAAGGAGRGRVTSPGPCWPLLAVYAVGIVVAFTL